MESRFNIGQSATGSMVETKSPGRNQTQLGKSKTQIQTHSYGSHSNKMGKMWSSILQGIGESSLENCLQYKRLTRRRPGWMSYRSPKYVFLAFSAAGLSSNRRYESVSSLLDSERLEQRFKRVRVTVDVTCGNSQNRIVQYYLEDDSKRLILPVSIDDTCQLSNLHETNTVIVIHISLEESTSTLTLDSKKMHIVLLEDEQSEPNVPHLARAGREGDTIVYMRKGGMKRTTTKQDTENHSTDTFFKTFGLDEQAEVSVEYCWFELRGCGLQRLNVHKKWNLKYEEDIPSKGDMKERHRLLLQSLYETLFVENEAKDVTECALWDASPVDVAEVLPEAMDMICDSVRTIISDDPEILLYLNDNYHRLNRANYLSQTKFILKREFTPLIKAAQTKHFAIFVRFLAKLGHDSLCEDIVLLEKVEAHLALQLDSFPLMHRLTSLLLYALHDLQLQNMTAVELSNGSEEGDLGLYFNNDDEFYWGHLNKIDVLLALTTTVRAMARSAVSESYSTASINEDSCSRSISVQQGVLYDFSVDQGKIMRGLINEAFTLISRLKSLRMCWAGICRLRVSAMIAIMRDDKGNMAKCLNHATMRTISEIDWLKRSRRGPFYLEGSSVRTHNGSQKRKERLEENIIIKEDVDFYLSCISYLFTSEDQGSFWHVEAMPSTESFLENHIIANVYKILELLLSTPFPLQRTENLGKRSCSDKEKPQDENLLYAFQHCDGLNSLIYALYNRFRFHYSKELKHSSSENAGFDIDIAWNSACKLAISTGMLCGNDNKTYDLRAVIVIGFFHLLACRGDLETKALDGNYNSRALNMSTSPDNSFVCGLLRCVLHVLNSRAFEILDFHIDEDLSAEDVEVDELHILAESVQEVKLGRCLSVIIRQVLHKLTNICINTGIAWSDPVWELIMSCTAKVCISVNMHRLALKPLHRLIKSYVFASNLDQSESNTNSLQVHETPDCIATLAFDIVRFAVLSRDRTSDDFESGDDYIGSRNCALDKAVECLACLLVIEKDKKVIESQIKLAIVSLLDSEGRDSIEVRSMVDKLIVRLEDKQNLFSLDSEKKQKKDTTASNCRFVEDLLRVRTLFSAVSTMKIKDRVHVSGSDQNTNILSLVKVLVGDLCEITTPWVNAKFLYSLKAKYFFLSNEKTCEEVLLECLNLMKFGDKNAKMSTVRLYIELYLLNVCESAKRRGNIQKRATVEERIHSVIEVFVELYGFLYSNFPESLGTEDREIDMELGHRLLANITFVTEFVLQRINSNLVVAALNRINVCWDRIKRSPLLNEGIRRIVEEEGFLGLNRTRYVALTLNDSSGSSINMSMTPLECTRSLVELCERMERGSLGKESGSSESESCRMPYEELHDSLLIQLLKTCKTSLPPAELNNVKRTLLKKRKKYKKVVGKSNTDVNVNQSEKRVSELHVFPAHVQATRMENHQDGGILYQWCTYAKTGLDDDKAVIRISWVQVPSSKPLTFLQYLIPDDIQLSEAYVQFMSLEDACVNEMDRRKRDLSHAVFHPILRENGRDKRPLLNFIGRELEDVLSPQVSGMGAVGLRSAVALGFGVNTDRFGAFGVNMDKFRRKSSDKSSTIPLNELLMRKSADLLNIVDKAFVLFSEDSGDREPKKRGGGAKQNDFHLYRKDRLHTLHNSLHALLQQNK